MTHFDREVCGVKKVRKPLSELVVLVIAMLLLAVNAGATLIVDTGPGPGGIAIATVLDSGQFVGGAFTTTTDWVVNSLEGWIGQGDGGTASAAIYTGGATPGVELFSSSFSIPTNGFDSAWEGPSGLGWFLPAGSYWATFEVRPGQTYAGALAFPVPNPLSAYAFYNSVSWNSTDSTMGFRIDASAPAPEPATLFLLGAGLIGLVVRTRAETI